jgi:surface protein
VGDVEQKFVGLIAVFEQANFTAFTVAGAYTVDWGNGVTENYSSGATALHAYDFADVDLAGSNRPVTLIDSGDFVERTAHGYLDGETVRLWNVTGSTGPVSGQEYYVISATPNTFQISETSSGSAVTITTNGTATLLPYKQAVVTVTPQAANNITSLNLNIRHTQAGLQGYETGWLDIEIGSPDFTSLTIGSSTETVRRRMLERVRLVSTGSVTSMSGLFQNCSMLQSVPLFNTAAMTNTSNMFLSCVNLQSVPLFNTANVTNMTSMFQNCPSLHSVPLFNTANVTNMTTMFQSCSSLQSVPLFNTANVTNMTSMFLNCVSLQSVPLFNTAAVTNMTSMLQSCSSLQSVPLFNTANVTSMLSMFQSCQSLQRVPLFNTANVTNMISMFINCSSLQSVPLFNTASVTNMQAMFNSCQGLQRVSLFNTANVTNTNNMFVSCNSLQSVPLFNTANVTNMISMFQNCVSLQAVPALNVSAVSSSANFANMFSNSSSLSRIQAEDFNFTFSVASCKLSAVALNEIYTNLPTVVGQTITVTGNYGTATHNPTIATGKGWTVTV